MILRVLASLVLIAGGAATAAAQQAAQGERVTVATTREAANGALFLAAVRGYFKAEGLDIQMGAYPASRDVAEAVAAGHAEFGLSALTPGAFNLAGRGVLKFVAAQLREKRGYEGDEVVVSNAAYDKGVRKFEDLANTVVAVDYRGTALHYQLGQIARAKGFDLDGVTVKPLAPFDAMAKAVAAGKVDAAILPAQYARDLVVANQAKLIGWYSDIDEQQTGALFTVAKTIETRRATVEKFVRAYVRGVADYAAALLRRSRYGKRVSDAASQEAARIIARYVYPGRSSGAAVVEANAYFMDPKARIDMTDIERQLDWYKAQGFVDKNVDAGAVIDLSFTAGN
jgi:NitT/TauT family transport system substrate-binding protein